VGTMAMASGSWLRCLRRCVDARRAEQQRQQPAEDARQLGTGSWAGGWDGSLRQLAVPARRGGEAGQGGDHAARAPAAPGSAAGLAPADERLGGLRERARRG
jgi:hypothetical protein